MQDEDIIVEADGSEELGSEGLAADTKLAKLKKELEQVKREKQEYLDGWQRAKADYVNALKRAESERLASKDEGVVKTIAALLPAYDALERAQEHGDVPEGFMGIMRQLESAFIQLGVTTLGVVGEPFDPVRHEALGTDPTDDPKLDDHVTAVLEKGYMVGQTVLRPARVRVAHWQ